MNATYSRVGTQKTERALTCRDLVALLAAGAVLGLLQLPSVANSKAKSIGASCLSNHRQLARAWLLYAGDNNGNLVGNLDGGDASVSSNSNKTWVLGWFDFSGGTGFADTYGGRANTNTFVLTQLFPLAPYLGRRAEVFKCPADTSLSHGTRGAPRVRSVSMNSYVGDRIGPYTSGYHQFKKITEFVRPGPAKTFVFIDEREDSINDGWFAIGMSGFDPPDPSLYKIVDFPADWHNRGVNLSFADGHTETWHWRDRRTMPKHARGALIPLGQPSPNNPDVARIQSVTSSRLR